MSTIRTGFIQTPRLLFHYRAHGDEDGLPMLLLHGSYASSRWWAPFFAVLPEEICALAPDLRGCGQSEKSARGYTIEEQAEDLWALVQALAWDEFDLVGHSSGGAMAIEFALHHAERLHTLTLVDSAPMEGVFTPLDAFVLLEQMKTDRELLSRALAALMPTFPVGPEDDDGHAFFQQLVADAQQMAPAAFTGIATALGQWNRFAAAKSLTLPTLLIWGELDQIVDRDATTRTLIAIPGANNLEVLRNVGHSPMIEAPVALAERIIDFITEDFADYDEIRNMAADAQ
jgi:branched-chain amino acid transport system permease protein